MEMFYVPELNSNVLLVSESEGDPSMVTGRLIAAATEAQLVCKINLMQHLH